MCPGWYRQSSNAATIAFGMEIDVASYLDSAHGAKSRLRGAFRALLDGADHRHHVGARARFRSSISATEARGDYRIKPRTGSMRVLSVKSKSEASPSHRFTPLAGNPA